MLGTLFTGTFIDIAPEDITGMLGYAKDLIIDLKPLLWPVIGIGLAILIVWAIIGAFR
jgi:hypothetical protein